MEIRIMSYPEWRANDSCIEYSKKGHFGSLIIKYDDITTVEIISDNGKNRIIRFITKNESIELPYNSTDDRKVEEIIILIGEINPVCVDKFISVFKKKEETKEIMTKRELEYKSIIISTCDLKQDYDVIAPVYFQLNDAGTGSRFMEFVKQYKQEIDNWKDSGQSSADSVQVFEAFGTIVNIASILTGGSQDRDLLGNGHYYFDLAFFIACSELQKRAARLNADAIIGMRQDIDMDTVGFQHFYLQMYGTAVKFKKQDTK